MKRVPSVQTIPCPCSAASTTTKSQYYLGNGRSKWPPAIFACIRGDGHDTDAACSATIGIGFSSKNVALSRTPGWEVESWGYHGDDGNCFASQNTGKNYGPPFTTGDVIGCGVNFRTGCAFFTKNGTFLGKSSGPFLEFSHRLAVPWCG